ncbi:pore-forming ESAT-6 family protein [Neobacillus sp. PS2-9]|jgi:WXG100 family type VII secretion target|uniref:pore-forming ESAT-6 family protein n=1 Tax=Neobacillus sp. PS2-9 TaxID=3070676 RepID=UPI0027DFEDD9|nr:pore-forming ESAT-6 family protein [Neobacillus sp. PS2-9]WML60552.1 pore-forming ESAT-6 family protein [Neobacillus sp. PS2-9]
MAAEGINISLPEVSSTAQSIKAINQDLSTRLEEIKKEMGNLAQSWQSDASNTIRDKFNALAPRFEEYKNVINSYAIFLDQTVDNYNQTETAINNNASQFK